MVGYNGPNLAGYRVLRKVCTYFGAPPKCVPFFVSYIAILGVLFMRDLAIYFLFMIIIMFHSGLIIVVCVSSFFILIF